MSHVRFLFLPLLLLVGIQAVCSGTDRNAGEKDSIFARVESFLAGSDDDSLRTVSEAIIYHPSGDDRIALAGRLYESGKRGGDYLRMIYGSSILGANYLLYRLNEDSCLFYLNACLTYKDKIDSARMEGHRWVVAYAYNTLGLFYINLFTDYTKASGYFFQALNLLEQEEYPDLYAIVLANLVLVHYFTDDSTGMEYAELCYDYMSDHRTPFTEYLAEYSMAQMYYVCGDYGSARKSVERAAELMVHPSISSVKYNVATYTLYARVLFAQGKDAKAEKIALQAISWSKDDPMTETIDAYLILGDYYRSVMEYSKAVSLYEEAVALCEKSNVKINLDQVFRRASEASELSGQTGKALQYYKLYHEASESIYDIAKKYALEELKVKYRIEQYENQIKERQLETMAAERQRQMWFFLFLVSFLTGAGLWLYLRNKNAYYKRMVRQYRETVSLNRQIRSMEDQSESVNRYNSSLSKTKSEELYRQLEELMSAEHVYRDSDLTVDKLAAMLHTNRTYLSQVINEKTGMNYSRYVNRARMSEAIDRLTDPHENCLMKSLALDIGFKSATAFSKAFAEETGVSPSVYRRTALEMDKKAAVQF